MGQKQSRRRLARDQQRRRAETGKATFSVASSDGETELKRKLPTAAPRLLLLAFRVASGRSVGQVPESHPLNRARVSQILMQATYRQIVSFHSAPVRCDADISSIRSGNMPRCNRTSGKQTPSRRDAGSTFVRPRTVRKRSAHPYRFAAVQRRRLVNLTRNRRSCRADHAVLDARGRVERLYPDRSTGRSLSRAGCVSVYTFDYNTTLSRSRRLRCLPSSQLEGFCALAGRRCGTFKRRETARDSVRPPRSTQFVHIYRFESLRRVVSRVCARDHGRPGR